MASLTSMTKRYHHAPYPAISPSNPKNNQAGRTVAITGGVQGIGYATARAYIQAEAAGVILLGRTSQTLQDAAASLQKIAKSTKVTWHVCDINIDASIEKFWDYVASENIYVDILVLNAASAAHGPIVPMLSKLPLLREMFYANVCGNALMAARFLDQKKESTQAQTLVNISTGSIHCNPAPHQALYSSSKAAFTALLQHVADEVESSTCQIVSIHPGVVYTEGMKRESHPDLAKVAVFDEVDLPAAFSVWASTPAASFLHGRFVWAQWDVEELSGRKQDFEDQGFLKVGLQGTESLDVASLFDQIRKKDAEANGTS
ncbi:short-chain dehydrogenase/reductase [Lophiostoma macrostomum CBS 122681]|uniref:Short-chain dehydrogenase/reductase n=1 Tax=Lophiostoma macrostomum CBS 122681 TaxID=1314788 RepID=A0A6A6T5U1_9PLEO|nr:short-chain dehydrogenase/reductase [Lophiostoma macrostomum CBS 122681]